MVILIDSVYRTGENYDCCIKQQKFKNLKKFFSLAAPGFSMKLQVIPGYYMD